jgi:hypothetical protein
MAAYRACQRVLSTTAVSSVLRYHRFVYATSTTRFGCREKQLAVPRRAWC